MKIIILTHKLTMELYAQTLTMETKADIPPSW